MDSDEQSIALLKGDGVNAKIYRKTPVPVRRMHYEDDGGDGDDEDNIHPIVQADQKSLPASPLVEAGSNRTTPRTPLAAAFIAKHISSNDADIVDVLSGIKLSTYIPSSDAKKATNNSPPLVTSTAASARSACDIPRIHNLSQEEYDAAPRIVKMQVTMEEVNQAAEALTMWLRKNRADRSDQGHTAIIEERHAYEALQPCFDERKRKSVLMSLCHFRRMVMRLPSKGQGKLFVVSQPRTT